MRPFLINVLRAMTYQALGAALLTPGAVALAVLIGCGPLWSVAPVPGGRKAINGTPGQRRR